MEPTLYILMRNDLESLNPGKAIAQGSHATNQFEREALKLSVLDPATLKYKDAVGEHTHNVIRTWREDRDFGRCLCVAASPWNIEGIDDLVKESNYVGGTVVDPTYPIRDGAVTHTLPLLTCGWVFVWDPNGYQDKAVLSALKKLELYK